MNKQTLIWTLIVAMPAGLAALAAAYYYNDTGRLPFQEPAETVSAPAASGESSETRTTAAEAKPDQSGEAVNQNNSAADGTPVKGPSFDVVGIEPTGETVVAGRSDAGAIVALTANGQVVGKSIANEAGEWTIILNEPLKPGDYDVGLEVHDDKGTALEKSEQHLAVSVPEDGKEQPLVVLNSPDGPSDILQKPEGGQQVAAAPQTAQGAADITGTPSAGGSSADEVTGKPASVEPTQSAGASSAGEAEPAVAAIKTRDDQDPAASTATEVAAAAPSETGGEAGAASQQSAPEVSATAQKQQPASSGQGTAAAALKQDQAGSRTTALATDTGAAQETASDATSTGAQPAVAAEGSQAATGERQADAPAATVTVEAVESETDKVFVAGTAEPGSSVRVYVGEEFQGEAKVNSSGKWLVQGTKNVDEGNVEVRADQIGDDGNSVDARAAVTFEKERDKQVVLTKVVASGAGNGTGGQGAQVKKSLPVIIIRKGDNLWRISRRLYGDGVRYTTIYQANQDQIRNPDLIYPGQVFLTPEGDLNWPKPTENNG